MPTRTITLKITDNRNQETIDQATKALMVAGIKNFEVDGYVDEFGVSFQMLDQEQYNLAMDVLAHQNIGVNTLLTVPYARYLDDQAEDSLSFYCEECKEFHDMYSPMMDAYNDEQQTTDDFQHDLVLVKDAPFGEGIVVVAR